MKNSIISIIIFLFTMISVTFLNNSIVNLCEDVQNRADQLEETIMNDDYEKAFNDSMELVNLLKEKNLIASVYVTHECFDSLTDECIKLSVYLSYNDGVDSNATLHVIKNISENIKKLQIPTLENIL